MCYIRSIFAVWRAPTLLTAVACGVLLSGMAQAQSKHDFVIGVIAGISGSGSSYGRGIVQGAEMAAEEINAAGGINGRKIKLRIVDDKSDPTRSAIVMRRLLSTSPDLIVGGWGSSQVLTHMHLAEQSALPYIVVGATHPRITTPSNHWVFRVIQTDSVMAKQLAKLAVNDFHKKRIAIIYDSNAYGAGNRDVFVTALQNHNLQAVDIQPYGSNATDFHAMLTHIKAANPDAIALFGTLPAAPLIMQQARTLGITARFLGTGGLASEALIAQAPAAAEGAVLMSHFHEDTDTEASEWNQRYQRFAAKQKHLSAVRAAWEYRAIKYIAAPCLGRTGNDRVALRDCIASWRGKLPGINTETYFDASGQLVQPPLAVQIRDGHFRLLRTAP